MISHLGGNFNLSPLFVFFLFMFCSYFPSVYIFVLFLWQLKESYQCGQLLGKEKLFFTEQSKVEKMETNSDKTFFSEWITSYAS